MPIPADFTPYVVAIDGPSGSGKSSTSRGVATRLGCAYLDTGATYRAMTWALRERGIDTDDPVAVGIGADAVEIAVGTDPAHPTIHADGVDVSVAIRGDDVTAHVSPVATVPRVREILVALQRDVIRQHERIVVEGRDIGSTVAPDAPVKIYLVADPAARALRRAAEVGATDTAATQESLARRDLIDSTRATSPAVRPDGSTEIDSTHRTLDEVIELIVGMVDGPS